VHELSTPGVDERSVSAAVIQSAEVRRLRATVGQTQDVTNLLNERCVSRRTVHVAEDRQLALRLSATHKHSDTLTHRVKKPGYLI